MKHLMKILKKTLANPRLVQHYKINVVHHRVRKKKQVIISTDTEKAFNKFTMYL